ncbi:MAG: SGNH/GDSL hydrolase family protein [Myxococcota bacterium]|nr:SGNH/GDSL hydrolase family protein [Myxococcota bacterium]
MSSRVSRGRKLLFSGVVLLAFLALFEGGARIWERARPAPTMPEPVPRSCPDGQPCFEGAATLPPVDGHGIRMAEQRRAGWGFVPGSQITHGNVTVTINSLGLRGPQIGPDPEPGEVRLFSLGDSSVYGYGVEDGQVFLDVTAAILSDETGMDVLSVNGALPGYSSRQALTVLQDVGPVVRPDWLVIACIWSDLFHTDEPLDAGGESPLAAVRMMKTLLQPWLPPRTIGWWDPEQGVGTPGPGKSPRVALGQYMDNLHALVLEGAKVDARPVFLILPAPVDLDPAGAPAYVGDYRAAMATVAEEIDAPLVDGPRYFARHGAGPTMFFDQVHPSAEGHRLLGEALAEALEDRLD